MGPNFLFRTDKKSSGPYINCQENHIQTRSIKCLLVLCAICIRWLVNGLWVVCGHIHRHIYKITFCYKYGKKQKTSQKGTYKCDYIIFDHLGQHAGECVNKKNAYFGCDTKHLFKFILIHIILSQNTSLNKTPQGETSKYPSKGSTEKPFL